MYPETGTKDATNDRVRCKQHLTESTDGAVGAALGPGGVACLTHCAEETSCVTAGREGEERDKKERKKREKVSRIVWIGSNGQESCKFRPCSYPFLFTCTIICLKTAHTL